MEYLGLEGGPPDFLRRFLVSRSTLVLNVPLSCVYATLTLFGLGFPTAHSTLVHFTDAQSLTP